ncbi:MAG: hypothetical protein GY811_15665 [Myxococcales bacterium]|nr:hypothetical protein [Myxococcales bacterium]
MRLGPVVHGGLLAVALAFSYQTSTRKEGGAPKRGTYPVWKLGALSAVVFESESKRVRIEERTDENGSYYWGEIRRSVPAKKSEPHQGGTDTGDAEPIAPPAVPEMTVTTREFPVGVAGEELMSQYQSLVALRKLGSLEQEKLEYYNLHEKTISLTAIEKGKGERSLLLANEKIYGGTDRYMFDVDKGLGYVFSGKLIQPLQSAESSLSIKKVHAYDDAKVTSIAITTTGGDTVLVKRVTEDAKGEHIEWSYEVAPEATDTALAGFVDRVKKLKPTRYEPELKSSSLVHIATLRYRASNKRSLGYLELYRQLASTQEPKKKSGSALQTQYYIKTERTRVLGKVGRLGADRVDQDLVELFGIAPAPVAPDPVAPTPVAPDPVAPTAVTPDPVAPTAVTPDPVAPTAVTPTAMP